MTNNDAREAAVERHTPAETCHLLSRDLVRAGWDDCVSHLRATGQLCTAEEQAVLDAWKALRPHELDRLARDEGIGVCDVAIAEIDRRAAKGTES